MIQIGYASHHDKQSCLGLLTATRNWLREQATPLWEPVIFDDAFITPYIKSRELVVAKEDNDLVGMMLLCKDDPLNWPDINRSDGLYLHKLCVKSTHRKTGLSHKLMQWAEQEAKHQNRHFLRLDCTQRDRLINVYLSFGFKIHSTIQPGVHTRARLEKPV